MKQDPLISFLEKRTPRRFAAVVEAHRDEVLNAAFRVLGERTAAEDVAQEVFLKLLTVKWDPGRIRSARGLLTSTAVLAALAVARAEGRRQAREAAALRTGAAAEAVFTRGDILDVRDAVLDLPEGLRAAVELRYFGGLTVKEVALTLGCAAETAKDRLARARGILRDRLAPPLGAIVLVGLAGDKAGAWPATSASAALRRELRRLTRDGPSLAAVAAGGALGGSIAKPVLVCALLGAGLWALHEASKNPPPAGSLRAARIAPSLAPSLPGMHEAPLMVAESSPSPERSEVKQLESARKPYLLADAEDGKPLGGVSLVFAKHFVDEPLPEGLAGELSEVDGSPLWSWTTSTDASGGFEYPSFARPGEMSRACMGLELLIRQPGYIDLKRSHAHGLIPQASASIELERAPEVMLQVLQESGRPADRYELRLDTNLTWPDEPIPPGSPFYLQPLELEVEAEDGIHRFQPGRRDWKLGLMVRAPGFPPQEGKLFPYAAGGSQRDLVLKLERERLLRGVVVDARGTPVPSAWVIAGNERAPVRLDLMPGGWESPGRHAPGAGAHRVECGPDGSFAIAALPGETWLVAIHSRQTPSWARFEPGDDAAGILLTIGHRGSLRVTWLDGAEAPVAAREIVARLIGWGADPGPIEATLKQFDALPIQLSLSSRTDAEGLARIDDLPPGHYYCRQTHRKLEVRAGETTDVVDREPVPEPPVPATARVHGRITVDGRPLQNPGNFILMDIAGQSVLPDSAGYYAVDGVPAGEHWILPPSGYQQWWLPKRLVIPPGAAEVEFTWNYPLCRFQGRIVDAEAGRPIAGARLEVHGRGEDSASMARLYCLDARADGRFQSFPGRPHSSGSYALVAFALGFALESRTFEITDQTPAQLDFELRLTPASDVLTLRFETAGEGRGPLNKLQVALIPDTPLFEPPAVVSEEGSVWSWYGLPAGRYLVAADTRFVAAPRPGFAYEGLTVRAGSGSVERTILLPPAGELLIEARDASGRRFAAPVPTIHLERADGGPAVPPLKLGGEAWRRPDPRVFEGGVDDIGILHLQGVPVGLYRIGATRPGFQPASAEAEVEEGRRADVVMALAR